MMMLDAGQLIQNQPAWHIDGNKSSVLKQRFQVSINSCDAYSGAAFFRRSMDLLNLERSCRALEHFENCLALLCVSFHILNSAMCI